MVEKISEEKKNKELMVQIRELECAFGRKQLELDYYKEVISIINEEDGEDVVINNRQHKSRSGLRVIYHKEKMFSLLGINQFEKEMSSRGYALQAVTRN